MNQAFDSAKDERGYIDFPGVFAALAAELIVARKRGKLVSHTKNIRDSGLFLEASFRKILGERLPPPFTVHDGYLFEPSGRCTPQIDVIITDAEQSYEVFEVGGALYTPFSSAYAIGEIKSSGGLLAKHIEQISAREQAINSMRNDLGVTATSEDKKRVYSFLVVADADEWDETALATAFRSNPYFPHFILALSAGRIYAPGNDFFQPEGDVLTPSDSRGIDLLAYEPTEEDISRKQGLALMWAFHALRSHLATASRRQGLSKSFSNAFFQRHPLRRIGPVLASSTI